MKSCSRCGLPIPTDSPEGICARCLLGVAVEVDGSDTIDAPAAQAISPTGTAPTKSTIDIADVGEVARLLPQFEIMELLGRGGMGVVYKARQIQLDRIVALKILPPADAASSGFVERFRREAKSLAKLSHPNIVSVHDFGETNGLFYFVMEFVDGLNLRQMILAHRLTPAEALAVVPKICDALQFAHEEGLVHRDIKPENILIDKRGRVKIADFGLAKLLGRAEIDPRLTVTGATLGTPRYMAPEQMEKPETVDHRADIYSLGVVFYEMLTGELPMGRFAPPSKKVQIDVRLDEIVLHALERDVELRYQHASEVRDDVEEVTSKKLTPIHTVRSDASPAPVVDYAPAQPIYRFATMRSQLMAFFVPDPNRWWVIGASVALFVFSLFLPAAYFYKDSPHAFGWPPMSGAEAYNHAFNSGNLVWLANPSLWVAWILLCFRRRSVAFIAGVIALSLALWVLIDRNVVDNYITINGVKSPMGTLRLQAGYACWLVSAAVFVVGSLLLTSRKRRQPVQPTHHWIENISLATAISGILIGVLILFVPNFVARTKQLAAQSQPPLRGSVPESTSIATPLVVAPLSLAPGPANLRATLDHGFSVFSVAFSPDGKTLATGSGENAVELWDVVTGKKIHTLPSIQNGSDIVAFSPDGQTLATVGGEGKKDIVLWNADTALVIATLRGHNDVVQALAFSPDGTLLASGGNQSAKLWDVATRRIKFDLPGHTGGIASVAFSRDGKMLASGSSDKSIKLWDVATGNESATIHDLDEIASVAFAPDGESLVSASGKNLEFRDVATGAMTVIVQADDLWVHCVAFNRKGTVLASGGERTIKLWDAKSHKLITTLEGHGGPIVSVAFSPDGKTLASASWDKTARLWNVGIEK